MPSTARTLRFSLRRNCAMVLVLTIIQYMLGVYVIQDVQFPQAGRASDMWDFAWSHGIMAVHIATGILLGIVALLFLARALRARDRHWRIPASIGFAGVVATGTAASQFVATQNVVWLYFMAPFFGIAYSSYLWGYLSN